MPFAIMPGPYGTATGAAAAAPQPFNFQQLPGEYGGDGMEVPGGLPADAQPPIPAPDAAYGLAPLEGLQEPWNSLDIGALVRMNDVSQFGVDERPGLFENVLTKRAKKQRPDPNNRHQHARQPRCAAEDAGQPAPRAPCISTAPRVTQRRAVAPAPAPQAAPAAAPVHPQVQLAPRQPLRTVGTAAAAGAAAGRQPQLPHYMRGCIPRPTHEVLASLQQAPPPQAEIAPEPQAEIAPFLSGAWWADFIDGHEGC